MVEIKLPYDKKSIVAKIPDENFAGLLESKAENFITHCLKKKLLNVQWTTLSAALLWKNLLKAKKTSC